MAGQTLYDKLWHNHVVVQRKDGSAIIYIDRHLIHEVTSPQAFEGLRMAGRPLWRRDANLAVPDHNVPTEQVERSGGVAGIADPISRLQVQTLDDNCKDFDIVEFEINDTRQGIVHVVGPEQGATLPGMTVVCGDSHTSTEMDEILSKYAGRPTEAYVVFSKSAHEYVCETVVHLSTGLNAQATGKATEIYAAF